MRTSFALLALCLAGCLSPIDYSGTTYRCSDGVTCPDGFQCVDSVCQSGPPPTGRPDADPFQPDADPTLPDADVPGDPDGALPHADASIPDPEAPMVDVPAGEFKRGCSTFDGDDCRNDTQPQRQVTLSAFQIDQHEVTQHDYDACAQARLCRRPAAHYDPGAHPDRPVTDVSWDDAAGYCRSIGKRLPSEAEWEKAARGGGTDSRRFPWGQTSPDCARTAYDNCTSAPVDVGSHSGDASPFGATEMAGNVAEWVADYYGSDYYTLGPVQDPTGPTSGEKRVVRGGDWESASEFLRTFDRDPWPPSTTKDFIGFRCAR